MVDAEYVTNKGAVEIFAQAGLVIADKTMSRWGKEGRIPSLRTLGGHRRYRVKDLEDVIATLRVPAREPAEAGS